MKAFFTKENLQQLKIELGYEEVSQDSFVEEFLVQIGQEFVSQTLMLTIQLNRSLPAGSQVSDESLAKFAMGKLMREFIWNSGCIETPLRSEENKKAKKSGQEKIRAQNRF